MNNNTNFPPPSYITFPPANYPIVPALNVPNPYSQNPQLWPLGGFPSQQTMNIANMGNINNFGNRLLFPGNQNRIQNQTSGNGNFPVLSPQSLYNPTFYPSVPTNPNANLNQRPRPITGGDPPKKRQKTETLEKNYVTAKADELLQSQLIAQMIKNNILPSIELRPMKGESGITVLKGLTNIILMNQNQDGQKVDFFDFEIDLTFPVGTNSNQIPKQFTVHLMNSKGAKIHFNNVEAKKLINNKVTLLINEQEFNSEANEIAGKKINWVGLNKLGDKPTASEYFDVFQPNARLVELDIVTTDENIKLFIPVYLFPRQSVNGGKTVGNILRDKDNKQTFLSNISKFEVTHNLNCAIKALQLKKQIQVNPSLKQKNEMGKINQVSIEKQVDSKKTFLVTGASQTLKSSVVILNTSENKKIITPLEVININKNNQIQTQIIDLPTMQNESLPKAELSPIFNKIFNLTKGLQNIIIAEGNLSHSLNINEFRVGIEFPKGISGHKLHHYRAIVSITNPLDGKKVYCDRVHIDCKLNKLQLTVTPGEFNFLNAFQMEQFSGGRIDGQKQYGSNHPEIKTIDGLNVEGYSILFEKFKRIVEVHLFHFKGHSDDKFMLNKLVYTSLCYIIKEQSFGGGKPIGTILKNPNSNKNFRTLLEKLNAESTVRKEKITAIDLQALKALDKRDKIIKAPSQESNKVNHSNQYASKTNDPNNSPLLQDPKPILLRTNTESSVLDPTNKPDPDSTITSEPNNLEEINFDVADIMDLNEMITDNYGSLDDNEMLFTDSIFDVSIF